MKQYGTAEKATHSVSEDMLFGQELLFATVTVSKQLKILDEAIFEQSLD